MDTKLQEYAKLLIEVGLNVQKGQTLIISSPVECASFARLCADAAYDAGCREVIMNWSDDYLSRQKFLRADASVFDDTPEWREKFFTSYAEMGAAYLAIAASDPETLKGVDPDRLVRSQKSGSVLRKTFDRLQMSNGFPWCIASVPIKKCVHLGTSLCKTENIVNEKKHVLSTFVTEILCHRKTGKTNSHSGSGGLIHLTKHHGGLINNSGFLHFIIKVISLTGTLTYTGKYGISTMLGCDIMNQLLDQYGFSYSCTTEKSDFSTLLVRAEKVNHLDSCL